MPETVPIPHPLPEQLVDLIAQRFRVLGEPMRIKLLDRLRDGEATVGQLQEALDASQQNVSKHLGVLLQAGMVSRSKRGTSSVFAIAVKICVPIGLPESRIATGTSMEVSNTSPPPSGAGLCVLRRTYSFCVARLM